MIARSTLGQCRAKCLNTAVACTKMQLAFCEILLNSGIELTGSAPQDAVEWDANHLWEISDHVSGLNGNKAPTCPTPLLLQ